MAIIALVNDQIRFRIKNIRRARRLAMREVARRAGIPLSSYSAMENGYYRLNADNLYRILEALEADINEVWPCAGLGELLEGRKLAVLREQDFRIHELVRIFSAQGAALIVLQDGQCHPVLNAELEGGFLHRLCVYVEAGQEDIEELIEVRLGEQRFVLYLEGATSPLSRQLCSYYLELWAEMFSADPSLLQAAKDRQFHP